MATYIKNRKATFDYELLDTFEAGAVLFGHEVKSIRSSKGKLEGAHVVVRGGEAFLVGASISPYQVANTPKEYDPERPRKLLLSKKELKELEEMSEQRGLTIVPLSWHNKGGKVKLALALARGKKKADKRESIKKRDVERDLRRTLREGYK